VASVHDPPRTLDHLFDYRPGGHVQLTWSGNEEARSDGLAMLRRLGASATVSRALTAGSPRPTLIV